MTEVIPENNRDYFPDNGMTAQKSLGLIFENLVPLLMVPLGSCVFFPEGQRTIGRSVGQSVIRRKAAIFATDM